jgi:two-component system, chemotaxis family, chemotaxis protein CheY
MRILVVDDDFIALKKVMDMLGRYGECDAATNGKQAIMMYCKAFGDGQPYDLVTLDIEMPELTGLEALRMLSEKEQMKQIPRSKKIMVTGSSNRTNVVEAMHHHCDAFLVKPITLDVLTRTLTRLGISAPATAPQTT